MTVKVSVLFERDDRKTLKYKILSGYDRNILLTNYQEYFDEIYIEESGETLSLTEGPLYYEFQTLGNVEQIVKVKLKPNLRYADDCFKNCSNLCYVEETLFEGTDIEDFGSCFYKTRITEIPENLFSFSPNAVGFNNTFARCNYLETIPENLFKFNTLITSLSGTFQQTVIKTIPENLFKYCTELTSLDGVFASSLITSIPENLFKFNTKLTDLFNTFNYCNIDTISENLFINNPELKVLRSCFSNCEKLISIPENLFVNNKKITNFMQIFDGCRNLAGTTPKDSDGGEIWERAGKEGFPASISGGYCFRNCTLLDNYANIPAGWK